MNIQINRNSETPIYLQIKRAIKELITSAELFPGYKMPSERKLAEELDVHRNTIIKAYAELIAEGYIIASRQAPKGYFVCDEDNATSFTGRFFPIGKRLRYNFNKKEKTFFNLYDLTQEKNDYISMGGLVINRGLYPIDDIENITARMFCPESNEDERLRKNICELLAGENIYVNHKNIQIASETNQVLNQLCDLFLSEGDCILTEEPLMPDNMSLFRNKRLNVITIPMEEDGMNMTILEKMVIKNKPKFIYTLPTYHNPTGITMSMEKRVKLLSIANKYGIPIIEESSQGVFNYTDNKLPTLYAMDKNQSVLFIDSFTLSFPYDVKIAYVVGPYDLIEMLGRYVIITETTIATITHCILNEFIERGYYEKSIKELVVEFKHRRDVLYNEIQKISYKGINCKLPDGGLSIWCTLDENIKEIQLTEIAKEKGLIIMPGFVFYPFGYQGRGHLRLSFSNCSDEEIIKGIEILSESIDICKNMNE